MSTAISESTQIPLIMVEPHLLPEGDCWAHQCPAGSPVRPCQTVGAIQGGEPGMRAHLRMIHPNWRGRVECPMDDCTLIVSQ